MTPEDIRQATVALRRRRAELLRLREGQLEDEHVLSGSAVPDVLDAASNYTGAVVLDQLGEAELEELTEIGEALQRIALGVWGRCEECDEPIPLRRLQAIPWCRCCVECAAELERRQQQAREVRPRGGPPGWHRW